MSDYLKIYDPVFDNVKREISKLFPGRKVFANCKGWHCYRYIQIETPVTGDFDIHYEYTEGYVELHLEGKYAVINSDAYKRLAYVLKQSIPNESDYSWHNWWNVPNGRYRYNHFVKNQEQLIGFFKLLIEKIDPFIETVAAINKQTKFPPKKDTQHQSMSSVPNIDKVTVNELEYTIKSINEINFNELNIPGYQRPYKWSVKNVNQLIDDIISFKGYSSYRLGSLVLYNNDIVDGQQRTITLSLLLHQLFKKFNKEDSIPYRDFYDNIQKFWTRTHFKNPISIANVRKNINLINERLSDLDEDFFVFLLEKCQFVVIRLPNITEAFQFFDSQNTRGKELEVHDLLKAFHLREIENFGQHDSDNINLWQAHDSQHLVELFIAMYRVKRWSKGLSARYLTTKHVDEFKGISLNAKNRYPYYMQQIVCHFFSEAYSNDPSRHIDRSPLEFPFQMDQLCINGSRFFDMVNHYDALYEKIQDIDEYQDFPRAKQILSTLKSYKSRNRVGDQYIRQYFWAMMFYYTDKFGFVEMDKATVKFFKTAFKIRLQHYSIPLATVDIEACNNSMFRNIRDAIKPTDVINLHHNSLEKNECATNSSEEIKELYFNI